MIIYSQQNNPLFNNIPAKSLKTNKVAFGFINNLEDNRKIAKEAYAYVENLQLFSTTKDIDPEVFNKSKYADDYSLKEFENKISRDRNWLDNRRNGKPIDEFVNITVDSAKNLRIGNCAENAILAAHYLINEKKFFNFALISTFGDVDNPNAFHKNPILYSNNVNLNHDHVFVVAGLDKNADLSKPETWGDNAVILDPWGEINATPVNKNGRLNHEWLDSMKKLTRSSTPPVFTNYAPFIDPTKDKFSVYNWENHRGNLK